MTSGRFLLLMGCLTGLAACGRDAVDERRSDVTAPPVEAVQARLGALPLVERLSGTVWAENQVALHPEITGRIAAVHVETGETVEHGQVLVILTDDQYREQVRQAEAGHRIAQARVRQAAARLAELESQTQRTRSLGERNLVTPLELETAEAQVESARADLDLAEAQLEQAAATLAEQRDLLARTAVRAPISGVVGQRNAEIGMHATPPTRLFTIGNLDRVLVRVNLTDTMLRHIETGQPVRIRPPGGSAPDDEIIPAALSRISPFLNEITRSTEGEIEVDNRSRRLRPGMFVPVDILYGQSRQATLVPVSALVTDPNTGRDGVFVLGGEESGPASTEDPASLSDPRPVRFRPVHIIARGDMEVAIDAIDPGDWVVTIGQDLLARDRSEARVRHVTWDHVMALQRLNREDLLEEALRPPAPARTARSG